MNEHLPLYCWVLRGWMALLDEHGEMAEARFGSPHAVCQFIFCGGSVRPFRFTNDAETHRRSGHRANRQPPRDF